MNESMFSAIDQIRQDSKDVRDFVKNVFKDRDFKKMSNDKDFIKYLKSIYEGTMIDEEHVKFSNRTSSGTIATGSVQTTKESVNEAPTKRSNDFFNDSKHGKAIYKLLGGNPFKAGKVKKYLDTLLDKLGDQKGIRVWDFIGKDVGLDVRKYGSQPVRKYEFALIGAIDDLYHTHIKESVNEASKLAMGIAGFTGTRGIAVDDFIEKNKIDAKKLFNFVKKGNLKDRMAFVSAIAGKPNNKMFKMITTQFSESADDVPQGYNPMVEDKKQIKDLVKKVKHEKVFYDVLSTMEKKYGKNKYRIWLEKSLKDFGANPKHYDYRTNAAAEEKLFQLGKK